MSTHNQGCCGPDRSQQNSISLVCPLCKTEGVPVDRETVEHLVQEEYRDIVTRSHYAICMSPSCDMVYFGIDGSHFTRDQLRVPVCFKDGAIPKYACYCSRVTEEQVLDAVVKHDAETLRDVIELTGAMKNSDCLRNNPLGVCCHRAIEDAIAKGKRIR